MAVKATETNHPTLTHTQALRRALFCYGAWGFFPVYWHLLNRIPAIEVLAHRMLWSGVFYALLFWLSHRRSALRLIRKQSGANWGAAAVCASLISVNWGVYIYAVNSGFILQGSMAYFINPLLNVVVGVLFFKEKFPRAMQVAFALACLGVLAQATLSGVFPGIALVLAATFCLYGVLKKKFRIPPVTSSIMEGAVGILPALIAAVWLSTLRATPLSMAEILLLIGGGAVTGLPLFYFSQAAQVLPYSLMGMLQFLAPTLQFVVGILYGEKLDFGMLLAFSFIWAGVGIYLTYLARQNLRRSATSV